MKIITLSPFLEQSESFTLLQKPTHLSAQAEEKAIKTWTKFKSLYVFFFILYHPKHTDFTVLAKTQRWHTKSVLI